MTPVVETEEPLSLSLSAYGIARSTVQGSPLSLEDLRNTDAYWRALRLPPELTQTVKTLLTVR
jgi:hypothetical protein